MLYAIIYELKSKTKDHSDLYTRIKDFGTWMHYIEPLWIIESTDSAQSIYDALIPFIDKKSDYIIVYELGEKSQGWMPEKVWTWLKKIEG